MIQNKTLDLALRKFKFCLQFSKGPVDIYINCMEQCKKYSISTNTESSINIVYKPFFTQVITL